MSDPRRQTILYILNSTTSGGANRSLAVLLSGLDRARFRPLAVAPGPGPFLDRLRDLEVPWTLLPLSTLTRRTGPAVARAKAAARNGLNLVRLGSLMERESVRLVHTNTVFPLGGGLAARLAPVPHVWHLREGLDYARYDLRFGRGLSLRIIAGLADRMICISEYVRRVSVPPAARQKAVVIPNALESCPPLRRPATGAGPVIGCLGFISPQKRTSVFIEVAGLLAARFPRARFIVAGRPTSGEEQMVERLQERVRALGLEHRFHWPGFVPDPEEVYRQLDLLVHPGVHEAFGRVLMEAMARGIPVVAVASGGVPEVVEDGVTGRIVQADHIEEIARAAMDCLDDPGRYQELSAQARRQALRRFAPRLHVSRVQAVYETLLDPGPG
ncbi:MAG: glycosyltransferase family 4 protein [Acidobacteriota bacterium]